MIKIRNKYVEMNVNWEDFSIIKQEGVFNGKCRILAENLSGEISNDVEKMKKITEIEGINEVIIESKDVRVGEYLGELFRKLKPNNIKCSFNLLNDFEMKDRPEIDFDRLPYDSISIPIDYMMWMREYKKSVFVREPDIRLKKGNYERQIGKDPNEENADKLYQNINKILDEIFENINLSEISDLDKIILVCNWIQRNISFPNMIDHGTLQGVIEKRVGRCHEISELTEVLLNNPRVRCKTLLEHAPDHDYNIVIVNGNQYIIDNTWNITDGGKIATDKFCDKFLLVGQDFISENSRRKYFHTPEKTFDGDIETSTFFEQKLAKDSFPREEVIASIGKLKRMGVEFDYHRKPIMRVGEVGRGD